MKDEENYEKKRSGVTRLQECYSFQHAPFQAGFRKTCSLFPPLSILISKRGQSDRWISRDQSPEFDTTRNKLF
jgi:hypothetical protein